MHTFAHALRSFHAGAMTQDELLSELLRLLAVERTPPAELIAVLEEDQLQHPLSPTTHAAIVSRITSWLLDPTVVTNLEARLQNESADSNASDAPETIILGSASPASSAKSLRAGRGNRLSAPGIGSVLQDRFRLTELIGEGGMSRVYKAIDLRRVEAGAQDPHIAVKVLTAPYSDYFGSIASLQREAQKLQNLTHPNIVRVIDCDRDGQTVFMTMEFLSGEPLNNRLRALKPAGMEPKAGESIVLAIAGALDYAHRNQIVHGDLKPGNVIVTSEGHVKVIDFGMARFIAPPIEGKAAGTAVAAEVRPPGLTPRYASPEMLAGHEPEPADDVYSLACVAYEILSGVHPGDAQRLLKQPAGMSPKRYRSLVHALEFDRNRRTPSVAAFVAEFSDEPRKAARNITPWVVASAVAMMIGLFYLWGRKPVPGPAVVSPSPLPNTAGTVLRDCPTCPLLVVLPVGRFNQGSAGANALPFEKPKHPVTIAYQLAMSINEITIGEFQEFADATNRPMAGCNTYDGQWQQRNDASWKKPGFEQSSLHPVTCTSWHDATAFAEWLSQKSGHVYRLPSASEWEYAATSGREPDRAWESDGKAACLYANVADMRAGQQYPGWATFPCDDRFVATAPVGSFKSNDFGVDDMLGNVFEWVQDCWHDDYVGAPGNGTARVEGDCEEHELRGGSWYSTPAYVRTTYRNRFAATYRSSSIGFRLVREIHN